MLTFGLILLGAIMVAHGWWHAGVTEAKTTGVLTGVAGLALAAAVLAPAAVFGPASVGVGTLLVLWAIYALLVASIGLLDFGDRTLGFYAIFTAVVYVLYLIWFLRAESFSGAGLVASAILAVAFFLLFLNTAPPFPRLTRVVAWIFILGGAVIALIGFTALLGIL